MLISASSAEKRAVQEVFEERFGVPARVLEEWLIYSTGSVLWGLRDAPRLDEAMAALKIERTGLPLLRKAGKFWKPTTVALQVMGKYISRSCVDMDYPELEQMLAEGGIRGTREDVDQGYVALVGPDGVIGCGLYLEPQPGEGNEEGLLVTQLPKARWGGFIQLIREDH